MFRSCRQRLVFWELHERIPLIEYRMILKEWHDRLGWMIWSTRCLISCVDTSLFYQEKWSRAVWISKVPGMRNWLCKDCVTRQLCDCTRTIRNLFTVLVRSRWNNTKYSWNKRSFLNTFDLATITTTWIDWWIRRAYKHMSSKLEKPYWDVFCLCRRLSVRWNYIGSFSDPYLVIANWLHYLF